MERRTRMKMQQMGMGDAQCCETSYELKRAGRGGDGQRRIQRQKNKGGQIRWVAGAYLLSAWMLAGCADECVVAVAVEAVQSEPRTFAIVSVPSRLERSWQLRATHVGHLLTIRMVQ